MFDYKTMWYNVVSMITEVSYEWRMWYSLAFVLMCIIGIICFLIYVIVIIFGPIGGWLFAGFVVALGLFLYCINSS